MIPFGLFLGICSGGLVFMLYFLAGFWRDGRRKHGATENSAIHIPGVPVSTPRKPHPFPVFLRSRTTRKTLIEDAGQGTTSVDKWQLLVNQETPRVRRAR